MSEEIPSSETATDFDQWQEAEYEREVAMRRPLGRTPFIYRDRPGMGRAWNSLIRAAREDKLTFDGLMRSTPADLTRIMSKVSYCGPKTIKLIIETLGIVERKTPACTPAANVEKTVLAMFGNLSAPQPMPQGGVGPDISELVIQDFRARNAMGMRKYGTTLRAHDGRRNIVDLYQELQDAVVYTRKEIEERKRTPFNSFASDVHAANRHWWVCTKCDGTGRSPQTISGDCLFCEASGIDNREVPKLLMLTVSELAEAMEGDRKDLMDDHLPTRKMFEVEIADTFIRLFDLAGRHKLDLDGAIREKMAYNQARLDHKAESRKAAGGKRY